MCPNLNIGQEGLLNTRFRMLNGIQVNEPTQSGPNIGLPRPPLAPKIYHSNG